MRTHLVQYNVYGLLLAMLATACGTPKPAPQRGTAVDSNTVNPASQPHRSPLIKARFVDIGLDHDQADRFLELFWRPDGQLLVIAQRNRVIQILDGTTGAVLHRISNPAIDYNRPKTVAVSPDGENVFVGLTSGKLGCWDTSNFELVWEREFAGGSSLFELISVSVDGEWLATSRKYENTIQVWSLTTGELSGTIETEHVMSMLFSADNQLAAMVGGQGFIYDLSTQEPIARFDDGGYDMAFSPDGKWLAMGVEKEVWFCSTRPGKKVKSRQYPFDHFIIPEKCPNILVGHKSLVTALDIGPKGRLLVSGSFDRTVRIWDVMMGRLLHTIEDHHHAVDGIDFSPNGAFFATADRSGLVLSRSVKSTLSKARISNSNSL